MSSRSARLYETLERVQQRRVEAELQWLKRAQLEAFQGWLGPARALLTEESAEQFSDAQRERVWTLPEQRAFIAQRAEIAFALELAEGAPFVAKLALEPYALPFGREAPVALVAGLTSDGDQEGREHRARALADATKVIAPRLLELRMRALSVHEEQLASLPEAPDPTGGAELPPGLAQALGVPTSSQRSAADRSTTATQSGRLLGEPQPAPPPTAAERAAEFLADTDDATREMTRWLVRPAAQSGTIHWHVLLRALRAPELDGLARPTRRWARIAHGLRGLDFERDLNARVRAEAADGALDPRVRVLAPSVPSDIRIVQSKLTYGVLSDAYAQHGVGHALALALVSPALPALLRRPTSAGVAEAIGMTFMQLRADPEYLRRVEAPEPLWIEKLCRHAGIIVMLETRLQAALSLVTRRPRNLTEWSQQLTAALERALGVEVPAGLATLAAWSQPPGSGAFEACAAGLAAHVGLRERFDADWYRNPRVSEVLRGAATRGPTLELATLLEELGVSAGVVSARVIELLG